MRRDDPYLVIGSFSNRASWVSTAFDLARGEVVVYALREDPHEFRYIGQTVQPRARLTNHIYDSGALPGRSTSRAEGDDRRSRSLVRSPRGRWIREVYSRGGVIEMVALSVVATEEVAAAEREEILYSLARGDRIENAARGIPRPGQAISEFLAEIDRHR